MSFNRLVHFVQDKVKHQQEKQNKKKFIEASIKEVKGSIKELQQKLQLESNKSMKQLSFFKNTTYNDFMQIYESKKINAIISEIGHYQTCQDILNKVLGNELINSDEQQFLLNIPKFQSIAMEYKNIEISKKMENKNIEISNNPFQPYFGSK